MENSHIKFQNEDYAKWNLLCIGCVVLTVTSFVSVQTNVNKFLGQHTSVETADDTVTTVPSGSGQDRPGVDRPDGGSVGPQPHGQGTVGNRNSFVNVVENTKKQLMKMGVNVDRLNAAEKSYRWVAVAMFSSCIKMCKEEPTTDFYRKTSEGKAYLRRQQYIFYLYHF